MDKKKEFIEALGRHEGLVYKVATVYTNNTEDRNDLVQEIIYQLWRSFSSFDNKAALSTWMYRVAMNTAINQLKKDKRKIITTSLDDHAPEQHDVYDDAFEEKWNTLKQHLNNLNLLDKGIVMLYLENKSYAEIARIIGISESNVGTKLSRIKEKLRNQVIKTQ